MSKNYTQTGLAGSVELSKGGARIKSDSGQMEIRNNADSALATLSIADGTQQTDAVTLAQLEAHSLGLSWKDAVRVTASTDGAIATAYESGDTVDGIVLNQDDRIALIGQTVGSENGIYVVQASGAPVRADWEKVAAAALALAPLLGRPLASRLSALRLGR